MTKYVIGSADKALTY